MTLVEDVERHGHLFEHWLGLKPWDLERYTTAQVAQRLAWIKAQLKNSEGGGDDDG